MCSLMIASDESAEGRTACAAQSAEDKQRGQDSFAALVELGSAPKRPPEGVREMPAEKGIGLVIRKTDFSETSRIVTLFTREVGQIRALAKGGRRIRGAFESALDLLSVCSIVWLRKSPGALDLLTEAQLVERFPHLWRHLPCLYAGYHVAQLLGDFTRPYDAHPALFDAALTTLRHLGTTPVGWTLMRFEMTLLRETGFAPNLIACAVCHRDLSAEREAAASATRGGIVCLSCASKVAGTQRLSGPAVEALRALASDRLPRADAEVERAVRAFFNDYETHLLGWPPRTLAYLEGT